MLIMHAYVPTNLFCVSASHPIPLVQTIWDLEILIQHNYTLGTVSLFPEQPY